MEIGNETKPHNIWTNSERYTVRGREREDGLLQVFFHYQPGLEHHLCHDYSLLVVITRCIYCSYGNAYYSLNRFDAWIYTV